MGWLRHQHYYTFITPEDKTMSSDAHRIAMFGDLEAMRKLVEEEKIVDEADDRGFTPLNWAVRNGHMEVLQLLIDNGCSLEKQTCFSAYKADLGISGARVRFGQDCSSHCSS